MRDFVVLVAFNLVQVENLPASFGQLFHSPTQRNAVDGAVKARIGGADVTLKGGRVRRNWLIERDNLGLFAAAQLAVWRTNDPDNCQRRFRSNRDFGLIVLAAIIIGKFS